MIEKDSTPYLRRRVETRPEAPLISIVVPVFNEEDVIDHFLNDTRAVLDPLGDVRVWETSYVQQLAPSVEGHPVRGFTRSTAMRRGRGVFRPRAVLARAAPDCDQR